MYCQASSIPLPRYRLDHWRPWRAGFLSVWILVFPMEDIVTFPRRYWCYDIYLYNIWLPFFAPFPASILTGLRRNPIRRHSIPSSAEQVLNIMSLMLIRRFLRRNPSVQLTCFTIPSYSIGPSTGSHWIGPFLGTLRWSLLPLVSFQWITIGDGRFSSCNSQHIRFTRVKRRSPSCLSSC